MVVLRSQTIKILYQHLEKVQNCKNSDLLHYASFIISGCTSIYFAGYNKHKFD